MTDCKPCFIDHIVNQATKERKWNENVIRCWDVSNNNTMNDLLFIQKTYIAENDLFSQKNRKIKLDSMLLKYFGEEEGSYKSFLELMRFNKTQIN